MMSTKKLKSLAELADIIVKEKASGKKIGFTNGCFDILHVGHIRYLEEARRDCDVLVIGVNSDSSVKSIKGSRRPINDEKARTEVLAALECVDYLALFAEDTPKKLIEALTPDILFKGGDWKEEDIAGADHVKANGGKVRVIPYVEDYSTTEIIRRILSL
ncbi:MAG: D-glycero-beta-D-manno-heptose 1-phosphate adenylyltransferase [Candidatus Omnitrophota bacterium]|jgi:D-beta-D-heptose 7-phosphate kinase/D-beta-D-heptose 1-phosphate adenosyltransferase